jgi:hypothetical protein
MVSTVGIFMKLSDKRFALGGPSWAYSSEVVEMMMMMMIMILIYVQGKPKYSRPLKGYRDVLS